jgi:hypothetical protein
MRHLGKCPDSGEAIRLIRPASHASFTHSPHQQGGEIAQHREGVQVAILKRSDRAIDRDSGDHFSDDRLTLAFPRTAWRRGTMQVSHTRGREVAIPEKDSCNRKNREPSMNCVACGVSGVFRRNAKNTQRNAQNRARKTHRIAACNFYTPPLLRATWNRPGNNANPHRHIVK